MAASPRKRPPRVSVWMRNVENKPTAVAPMNMIHEAREPDSKNASAMPGNTACEIASPSIAIRRRMRKQPTSAHEPATKAPMRNIHSVEISMFKLATKGHQEFTKKHKEGGNSRLND